VGGGEGDGDGGGCEGWGRVSPCAIVCARVCGVSLSPPRSSSQCVCVRAWTCIHPSPSYGWVSQVYVWVCKRPCAVSVSIPPSRKLGPCSLTPSILPFPCVSAQYRLLVYLCVRANVVCAWPVTHPLDHILLIQLHRPRLLCVQQHHPQLRLRHRLSLLGACDQGEGGGEGSKKKVFAAQARTPPVPVPSRRRGGQER
jgi:hypothetical protein